MRNRTIFIKMYLDSQESTVLKGRKMSSVWVASDTVVDNVTLRLVINVAYPLIIWLINSARRLIVASTLLPDSPLFPIVSFNYRFAIYLNGKVTYPSCYRAPFKFLSYDCSCLGFCFALSDYVNLVIVVIAVFLIKQFILATIFLVLIVCN